GCVLAGLAAGAIWTWLQSDRYRADARVLVRPASTRIVPAVEAVAESSLVESNVAQTLHLASPPDVAAKRGESGVLTVSVEAGGGRRATPTAPGAVDPDAERRLRARIEQAAKRERALAQRAGQLAAREQDLARREGELDQRAAALEAAIPEPEPKPAPEP